MFVQHKRPLCRLPEVIGRVVLWVALVGWATACGATDGEATKGDTKMTVPLFETAGSDIAVAVDSGQNTTADAGRSGVDAGAGTDTAGEFDVSFPVGDGDCAPQCNNKTCGPDGCGAVCGFCPSGQVCAADGSVCQAFCKPDCSAKKCGDNGCGGSCGDCPKAFSCGVDFLCHKNDCTPSCAAAAGGKKVCGGDGCGGSCGVCATGDVCDDGAGVCSPTACKGIPLKGVCEGSLLKYCEGSGANGKKIVTDCDAQKPAKVCAYDTLAGAYGCVDKPPCTPNCKDDKGTPKECGDDGCGGTCGGGCSAGWSCPGGFCQTKQNAKCGPLFPPAKQCEGATWLFCSSDIIQALDCGKAGQSCGWIAAAKTFGCK